MQPQAALIEIVSGMKEVMIQHPSVAISPCPGIVIRPRNLEGRQAFKECFQGPLHGQDGEGTLKERNQEVWGHLYSLGSRERKQRDLTHGELGMLRDQKGEGLGW